MLGHIVSVLPPSCSCCGKLSSEFVVGVVIRALLWGEQFLARHGSETRDAVHIVV